MSPSDRKPLYRFDYRRSADQDRRVPARHPVVVVGAGPVGLAAAIDLAQRGVPVVLLDDSDRIGEGSRGICYAKRTLEILDRLGVGGSMRREGRNLEGRQGLSAATSCSMPSTSCRRTGHKMPAFINLQQYYLERFLVRARGRARRDRSALAQPRRSALAPRNDGVTPHGRDAGRAPTTSTPIGSSPPTARARRLRGMLGPRPSPAKRSRTAS